jgi:hypothetical protein
VSAEGPSFGTSPVVVHRVNRQLELLVQGRDGEIYRTWWS